MIKRRLTSSALVADLVTRLFSELGLRPVRGGHVKLHFDPQGQLAGSEEHRVTHYVGSASLAAGGKEVHTSPRPGVQAVEQVMRDK